MSKPSAELGILLAFPPALPIRIRHRSILHLTLTRAHHSHPLARHLALLVVMPEDTEPPVAAGMAAVGRPHGIYPHQRVSSALHPTESTPRSRAARTRVARQWDIRMMLVRSLAQVKIHLTATTPPGATILQTRERGSRIGFGKTSRRRCCELSERVQGRILAVPVWVTSEPRWAWLRVGLWFLSVDQDCTLMLEDAFSLQSERMQVKELANRRQLQVRKTRRETMRTTKALQHRRMKQLCAVWSFACP